jgi:hypothetical protein
VKRLVRRRRPLPPDAAKALGITNGDRVLAWSLLAGGGAAAALVDGVRIVSPRGKLIARDWLEVDHAAWDQESGMLAVWWIGSRQTTPLEIIEDEGRLPEVIRERVQASVVLSTSVSLPGGRTGRVALRKSTDGSLVTQHVLPPGVHADAPDVAPRLAKAAASLRSEVGLSANGGPGGHLSDRPPSIR